MTNVTLRLVCLQLLALRIYKDYLPPPSLPPGGSGYLSRAPLENSTRLPRLPSYVTIVPNLIDLSIRLFVNRGEEIRRVGDRQLSRIECGNPVETSDRRHIVCLTKEQKVNQVVARELLVIHSFFRRNGTFRLLVYVRIPLEYRLEWIVVACFTWFDCVLRGSDTLTSASVAGRGFTLREGAEGGGQKLWS